MIKVNLELVYCFKRNILVRSLLFLNSNSVFFCVIGSFFAIDLAILMYKLSSHNNKYNFIQV